jgi:hypothetical protein
VAKPIQRAVQQADAAIFALIGSARRKGGAVHRRHSEGGPSAASDPDDAGE